MGRGANRAPLNDYCVTLSDRPFSFGYAESSFRTPPKSDFDDLAMNPAGQLKPLRAFFSFSEVLPKGHRPKDLQGCRDDEHLCA